MIKPKTWVNFVLGKQSGVMIFIRRERCQWMRRSIAVFSAAGNFLCWHGL